MLLRKAAAIAVYVLVAALLAVAVGCGNDGPPPEQELIKDLILLPPGYGEPGTPEPEPALASTLQPPPSPGLTPAALSQPAATPQPDATPRPDATPQPDAATAPIAIAGISFVDEPTSITQTYYYGDEIKVSFAFDSNVEVVGRPFAQLVIGDTTRYAPFTGMDESDPSTVYFTYTVQEDDLDLDGIELLGSYFAFYGNYIRMQGSAATSDIGIRATASLPYPKAGSGMVDGRRWQPVFLEGPAAFSITYRPGQIIGPTPLPAAFGGNGPLTYAIIQCAGSDNAGNEPVNALFEWLEYRPPDPGETHGGRLLPVGDATPPATMDSVCFDLTVHDADSDTSEADSARFRFSIGVMSDGSDGGPGNDAGRSAAAGGDYDADDNGLIEVDSLAQLDAIRYDLNGDGAADNTADAVQYAAAFSNPSDGMGCPPAGCIGYELTKSQAFDAANDTYNNDGQGWTPIGNPDRPFTATLDGMGHSIANLVISADGGGALGLFGAIGSAGAVKNLGLPGVKVHYAGAAAAQVGSIAGRSSGTVSYCYASGAVAGYDLSDSPAAASVAVGGLIGAVAGGTITGSYANVDVSGGSGSRVGGLVGSAGSDGGAIAASYASGAVNGGANAGVGGLVGELQAAGRIVDSYAVGVVRGGGGRDSKTGGLLGIRQSGATAVNSYYDAGATGQSDAANAADADAVGADSDAAIGKTTRELQSPTGSAGIYLEWDAEQWDFGTARQYPAVKGNGSLVPGQRQVSLMVDNWNHPVAGEPVEAILNGIDSDNGVKWQWQSSANGADWTDIADATDVIYVPVTADAADDGKYLRAKATFAAAASDASTTLTTVNTAKVIAAATADAGVILFRPQLVVGSKLEHRLRDAASAQAWRWRRCDDAEMTKGCIWIEAGRAAYTLQAGDVGKYFDAYAYYRNSAAWHRTESPVLGPIAAASTP